MAPPLAVALLPTAVICSKRIGPVSSAVFPIATAPWGALLPTNVLLRTVTAAANLAAAKMAPPLVPALLLMKLLSSIVIIDSVSIAPPKLPAELPMKTLRLMKFCELAVVK